MEKTDSKLVKLYELEDCYGKNFGQYSQFYHIMVIAFDGENSAQIIPFAEYSKELLTNYGSLNGIERSLEKYYPGSGLYYFIDEVPSTSLLRNRLRFCSTKISKKDEFTCDILEKKYFIVKSLNFGRSKRAKEVQKLGLRPKKVYIKSSPLSLSYTKPEGDFTGGYILSFSDIIKIREKRLDDLVLTSNNLMILKQTGTCFTEIDLEEALTAEYEIDSLHTYKPAKQMGNKIHTYYEYDPFTETNPCYGDVVEFTVVGQDENGSPIYKAADKILQNESNFSYALRVVANETRVFNRIPEGIKGDKILEKIALAGKSDRLHEFVTSELSNSRPGISYFIEVKANEKTPVFNKK